MTAIGVIGFGAISAVGRGADAVRAAAVGGTTRVARDEELAEGGLRKPFCARADIQVAVGLEETDRATSLLSIAIEDCLESIGPGWRDRRIGLAVGTSSGGMRSFTAPVEANVSALDRTYAGPLAAAVRAQGRVFAPASFVLAACASSAIAIGLGRAWLLDDRCDLVLAGGFDAVGLFVAAGFESLRATCGERGPQPFRKGRDGLALGEGGAILALAREPASARGWITGFGASCDAHHLTSPIADGSGLARAARAAWAETTETRGSEDPRVGLISAHGTATPQNDAAEAKAIASLAIVGADGAVPVFSFKGAVGHTLGAAGALETLAAIDALENAVAPATAGSGECEDGVRVLDEAVPLAEAGTALKLASAFGGANAALVISTARPRASAGVPKREARAVRVSRAVRAGDIEPAPLAARSGYAIDRITRADDLVRQALAAVAELRQQVGDVRGAGIVTGLGLATIETNTKFWARIARPEPRRFPYTTPNAAAGECAVAFGLDGPAFAVGGGPHGGIEAICVAADLVRAGVIDRVVVVAADEAAAASAALAPGTTSGALALLVGTAEALPEGADLTDWAVRYEPRVSLASQDLPPMHAHGALVPLLDGEPVDLRAAIPWGGEAYASLSWRAPGRS